MAFDAVLFPATRPVFVEAAVLTVVSGACMCLSAMRWGTGLDRRLSFLLTGSAWLVAASAGALPLWLWGLPLTDAFFESMSGITTTGSTVMTGLDRTAPGVLMWRAILQWIGGVGFIVAGIALLPAMRVGGMQLYQTESSEKGEKALASAARFAAATIWIYLALTALCAILYLAGGMTGLEAAVHALTTVSSGGYSTSDASFGHFDSAYLQWTGSVFMLSAGLPFAWYIRILNRGTWQSEQVRGLFLILATVICLLTLWRVWTAHAPVLESLRLVTFNVISVVTTTGFATTDYTAWGPFAATMFLCLTIMGGCTGSTSGGVKMMRWVIFARAVRAQVRRIHYPHGIFPIKYDQKVVEDDVMSGVMTFFTFFAATVFGLAFVLALMGLDFATAVSGAITSVANVGPGIGAVIGPAGNFSTLSEPAKWLLSLGMYVGRLEMLTVYILLIPAYWREIAGFR
jgi:trk system potassium uptake protein TrkH